MIEGLLLTLLIAALVGAAFAYRDSLQDDQPSPAPEFIKRLTRRPTLNRDR